MEFNWNFNEQISVITFDIPKIIPQYRAPKKRDKSNNKKMTSEDYDYELSIRNSSVKRIGMYINSKTPILHQCMFCGNTYNASPGNVLRGRRCFQCNKLKLRSIKTYNNDKYLDLLIEKRINIYPMEFYIDSRTKILHCNLDCMHIYSVTPGNVLSNKGCPICRAIKAGNRQKLSHTDYLHKLQDNKIDTYPLETYIDINTKILHQFTCGHQYYVTPCSILANHGSCHICSNILRGLKGRKDSLQFVQELYEINPYIHILSDYKTAKDKIKCECNICGFIWSVNPDHLLSQKAGCPSCNMSIGERTIKVFLDKNKINYIPQKKYKDLVGVGGNKLSYDFYLPDFNILIEFNGKQHYEPIELFGGQSQFLIQLEHDKRKMEYANNHKIHILIIKYDQQNDINNILTNYINSLSLTTAVCA